MEAYILPVGIGLGAAVVLTVIVWLLIRQGAPKSPAEAVDAFTRLKRGLSKTRTRFADRLKKLFGQAIGKDTIEELEVAMLEADMGVDVTTDIIEALEEEYEQGDLREPEDIVTRLKALLKEKLTEKANDLTFNETADEPTVFLVAGVNGVGKTTSIAKLAKILKDDGKSVILAASDTYRAAAVEQLGIWSDRIGVDIVKGTEGGDPAAVAYDATEAAVARKKDVLIVDTAGRLHTSKNLMQELEKIKRVIQKKLPSAPHEVILVLDATTGQNALAQARTFNGAIDVSGIFLAKMDGTAKGGIIFAIKNEFDIPVKFVGLGETPEDVEPFDPNKFVDALLAGL